MQEGENMKINVTFDTPALYGDHHVQEVRRILLETPGVEDVYASSAFRIVEVTFDDEKISEAEISQKLGEAGYLEDWLLPQEQPTPTYLQSDKAMTYFRHTEVFETSRQVVSFAQKVSYSGKPLWNCPGFGVVKGKMEE
jgi:copper chaperone CopZ